MVVSTSLMTGCPGVFAGGDMVPTERTVTVGVGHGKKAARHIDAYLRDAVAHRPAKHDVVTFDALHPWYFGDAARRGQPELEPPERVADFTEVVGGLDVTQATYEAGRCLSCGNCFECDGCLGACPEDAVIKLGVGAPVPVRLRPLHRLRRTATSSARYTRSRWLRRASDARDGRRQRGGGVGGLPAQRGVLHLPHHAVLADGGAGRRVGQRRGGPTCGAPCRRWSRCRARAARPVRCTARCRAGR